MIIIINEQMDKLVEKLPASIKHIILQLFEMFGIGGTTFH